MTNIEERVKELELIFKLTKDIVIISDSGNRLVSANDAFFEFFNQFKNLDEFNKKYSCICELFEKIDKDNYIYKNEKVNEKTGWSIYLMLTAKS
ncbi:MAG: hypothetical protein U9P72_09445 [Campylobacterota bacterium]|nr:hypothetical protein [Campylobacterota bacterium]